eukprot:6949608-Alexandrium_andersonii.AAC.1
MSASLVGSEMCIRDSSSRNRYSAVSGDSCDRAGCQSDCLRPFAVELSPVSYTHLTLPTICSV